MDGDSWITTTEGCLMPRQDKIVSLQAPTPDSTITIPHLFSPRSYQALTMAHNDAGGKRSVDVWHRRAGKDLTWLNQTIKQMLCLPFCATYLYIFPKLTQGRRDLWDAKSSPASGGIPFRAHFPPGLVMESSETEMQIILKPMPHQKPVAMATGHGRTKMVGSIFQVMGTDKESIENLRGINAYGCVFTEYQDQNPEGWEKIIQPVLMENNGWASFVFTPKGKNHGFTLYEQARQNPNWFCQRLTIADTLRNAVGEPGGPVVTLEQIEELRREGTDEQIIQQEYFCSFDGFLRGTIYGDMLKQARADGRIGRVPWVSSLPVGTMWDIGRRDATSIWFYQVVGSEIRFIDYYSNGGGPGVEHYVKVCRERPYLYAKVMLPHDAKVKGFSAVESTEEILKKTLCGNVVVAQKDGIDTGIQQVRTLFSRFYFDEEKCGRAPNPNHPSGLDCLANYHRDWNEDYNDYSGPPKHDQHSHGADALRTGAQAWEEGLHFNGQNERPLIVETAFDLRTYRQSPAFRGEMNVKSV